jgi:hypothetical protein
MLEFLKVVPLLLILIALLPPFRAHILIAGLIGGIAAVIIGGIAFGDITTLFLEGLTQILSITSVIMFAATAMVLARAGSTQGLLQIIQRIFKGRVEWVAAGMVLVQALATYAAGIGAANTLVTAPLIFALTGFVPLVIAGLSIVSGASWATSPASAESAFISQQMGLTPSEYSAFMRPYVIILWAIGIILAWYGVRRYRSQGRLAPPPAAEPGPSGAGSSPESVGDREPKTEPARVRGVQEEEVTVEVSAWRRALPFLVLLLIILVGPLLNTWIGVPLFSPVLTPVWVLAIAAVSMRLQVNKIGELFIDGGLTILRYLFLVGLFLGFIRLLDSIGTFEAVAGVVRVFPAGLAVIIALVVSFLVAIPSAAYTVAIDALIIPVLAAAGVPIWAFGFVGIAVAQGAMISPVQINVAATAHGFRTDILRIIRNNLPYMPAALVVTIILAVVATLVVA